MKHDAEDVLVAGLRLRFGREVIEARLHWPPNAVGPAAIALLLAEGASPDSADRLTQGLCAAADLVVVRVPAETQHLAALQWVADHAHELGGRADRLIVAGRAVSGAHAAWLAIAARDNGWPVLHRQVLVLPRFSGTCPYPHRLTGVAPATIVSGSGPHDPATRYAVQLKRCGVAVHQLRRSDPDDETGMVAALGQALQQLKGPKP
jgi:alpha/beta hydrolase fold